MTEPQRTTVEKLIAAGFKKIAESAEIVRLTKGADRRVVMPDGSQKRGHHREYQGGV